VRTPSPTTLADLDATAIMRRGGRTLRLALAAVVFALLVFTFRRYVSESGSSSSLYAATPWAWMPEMQNHVSSSRQGCGGLKGLERVVITVKTGATEALQKIPVQMRTSLRCAPHVLVFSDMAQTIGDIEVHDVLNETADEIKDGNRDFEIYRKQQELKDPQKIISQLKSFKTPGTKESASWKLDKYKNMHLVEKAWAMKPNMDWYLHIDADTYVILPSLAEWIKRLDPNKHMYLGRRIPSGNVFFGHGGSGILLSGEAMRVFAVNNAGTAARWDPKANTSCCGDILLSRALFEVGIPSVLHAWPSINGESPNTMPFGEQQWCEPIVTMHHVTVDEMETVAKFEINRRHMNVRCISLFIHSYTTPINLRHQRWTVDVDFDGTPANPHFYRSR
jgi:hypothetical protein